MSTAFPLPKPRGIDLNLPTCGETLCHGRGTCKILPGGSGEYVCDCNLGYQGQFCEGTVNGELSLPLTLSVLTVIVGLLILAIILAKVRQWQKKNYSAVTPSLPH
ncbi:protein crumbs homolog 2-like isoform X2 [Thalassophryne amazonica]|uniref:protein crumbs homolog 2-like isoform X2 n=1 Tax=Thalassophryne amazonica TaxID=390379 RepID=UPI001471A978|nr:protein crumbs homolog 2-like isoform X2 [Thalassophryne amazonica]